MTLTRTVFLTGALSVLSLLSGCANQRAIDSYVDAVMLNEVSEDQQAIAKLKASVDYNPKFALAYSLMGDIYQKNKDYPQSAVAYEKATELNRWSYKDFFNLGKVNKTMNKFSAAVKAYVRATQIQPDAAPAHLGAAQSYYELKDMKNALKYGKRAQQLDPNLLDAQQLMGEIYTGNKDYENAIAAYKRALEIDSNQPQIMNSLALAYLRAGHPEAAKELLESSLAANPTSTGYQHLGYAYLKLKNLGEAVNSYRNAVDLDPNDWAARKGLGVALMLASIANKEQGLMTQAIEQWEKSLALQPDQPKLRELLARYRQ